jgi:phosphatidylethanolamine-binding protein (PEBP) family uncharacterized protein
MGRLLKIVATSAALMLMPALAGCGGSSSTSRSSATATTTSASQTTPAATGTQTSADAPAGTPNDAQTAKTEHFPKITLRVSSPAFAPGSEIPVRYTCDGAGTSPPLHWGTIPKGTAELALFILGNDGESAENPRIYWAVAGLQPALKGVSAGKLPPGAIVGRNSLGRSGYTICPAKGHGLRHYAVALLALPRSIAIQPGFNASALFKTMKHTAEYGGLTGFTYKRR